MKPHLDENPSQTNDDECDINIPSPCSYGDIVPASVFKYGSILIEVTTKPDNFKRRPMEEAEIPFPRPDMTPPETRTYFIAGGVCGFDLGLVGLGVGAVVDSLIVEVAGVKWGVELKLVFVWG